MNYSASHFKHDLLLVGAGHSNVQVLRMFGMRPQRNVRITVVAREAHSPYSGMLPGFVYGMYSWEDIHIDLAKLCTYANARLIVDEVVQISPSDNSVKLRERPDLRYDCLVINTGGEPGIKFRGLSNVTAVKPIGRFTTEWDLIVAQGESGVHSKLVVVGGGPGSVEVALAVRERFGSVFDITIVSADTELMIQHNRRVRKIAVATLIRNDIKFIVDFRVSTVTDKEVGAESGAKIPCDHVLWVTGVEAPMWIRESGFDVDTGGFLKVDKKLRSTSHRNVFAGGDMVCLVGQERPKSGVFAVREGPILARNARAFLKGKSLRSYNAQRQALAILRLPGNDALASKGPWCLRSKIISRWKHRIDVKFMRRFKELRTMSLPALSAFLSKKSEVDEMRCGGCASKLGARLLDRVLSRLKANDVLGTISGLDDDAAVVDLGSNTIATSCDHFKPMITDPFRFGRVAAAHALNDLYAMGSVPKIALALVTVPLMAEPLMEDDFYQVLSGAVSVFSSDNVTLVGGHSAEGAEASLGFAVTGTHTDPPWFRSGMLQGQDLILTKPLGTGILLAGLMYMKTRAADLVKCIESMELSNKHAASLFRQFEASAVTDISGFGLVGHCAELVQRSDVSIELFANSARVLPGTRNILSQGIKSTLHDANVQALGDFEVASDLEDQILAPLVDPQTSGGLLAAVPSELSSECLSALIDAGYQHAAIVGRTVVEKSSRILN